MSLMQRGSVEHYHYARLKCTSTRLDDVRVTRMPVSETQLTITCSNLYPLVSFEIAYHGYPVHKVEQQTRPNFGNAIRLPRHMCYGQNLDVQQRSLRVLSAIERQSRTAGTKHCESMNRAYYTFKIVWKSIHNTPREVKLKASELYGDGDLMVETGLARLCNINSHTLIQDHHHGRTSCQNRSSTHVASYSR